MITTEKLRIYARYDGDPDVFDRMGTDEERLTISGDEWHRVFCLLRELTLMMKGLTSADYAERIRAKLLATAVDGDAATRMEEMAKEWLEQTP